MAEPGSSEHPLITERGTPGLPWAGCAVLGATAAELADLRAKALASDDVFVADVPASAQAHRVYAEHLADLAGTPPHRLDLRAVSVLGPTHEVDRLTERLSHLP